MGRPEKPPSSAYSLFSKEMLNTEEIKQFPSKERMSHISESWKRVCMYVFIKTMSTDKLKHL